MLPPLPYGCSLGHSKRWPGTISLLPTTLIDVVQQIGTWFYHSGVRRLFIVNTHVTNAAPLRCALEMLRATRDDMMVTVTNTAMMTGRVAKKSSEDAADWHANAAETSPVLAVAPEIARPELFATADNPNARRARFRPSR